MMIRSLRLDGFLSFAPGSEPFEMRPLNVLIGPNGAGKSNVIEALGLLAATPSDLARAVRNGGGSAEWLWKGEPEAAEATIEVVLDRGCTPTRRDLRYRLSFAPVAGQMKLQDEAVEELAPMEGGGDRRRSKDDLRCGRGEGGPGFGAGRGAAVGGRLHDQLLCASARDAGRPRGGRTLGGRARTEAEPGRSEGTGDRQVRGEHS